MKMSRSLLALALFLSLFGCSHSTNDTKQSDTENEQMYEGLVATEKTLPVNFYEIAFERETTPLFQYLIRKVVNQSEFEQTWDFYELENNIPNVNFTEKDVLFIGIQESGSCPYTIKEVELSSANNTMTVPISYLKPQEECTTDASPRTFVIQIDKEKSKKVERLVVVQSGAETNIPLEN
ncbi:hypothetical protein F9U64_17675 [Gracilibacillus oryzae]|uniref:PrcB C-terminal domain-containing protein n=1 Tax=Gracilibacillus oryzae TaxID=1672701 RepID=A0A7C8GRA6_9BACI|nr:hypothetical protein [Gracilibacillus oryzae]KAB8127476.1 hypothetical protein F9U64_17675 [Gracilibacillus oryzae]